MIFDKDSEYEKYYSELLYELSEVKALKKGFKFGVATTLVAMHQWADGIEMRNIDSINSKDIKQSFQEWLEYDEEVNVIFNRLLKGKVNNDNKEIESEKEIAHRLNSDNYFEISEETSLFDLLQEKKVNKRKSLIGDW